MVNIFSFENIAQQSDMFFKELTNAMGEFRSKVISDKKLNDKTNIGVEFDEIKGIIKKHTNLELDACYTNLGFHVIIPNINAKHIFNALDIASQTWIKKGVVFNNEVSRFHLLARRIKESIYTFNVDLKTGKIDDELVKIINIQKPRLGLNITMLTDVKFNDDEVAAMLLHEIGHVITNYIYMGRLYTTNEALNLLHSDIVNDNFNKKKQLSVIINKELNVLSDKELELVSTEKEMDFVMTGAFIDFISVKSNLSNNINDLVSCEYLADNYAARYKASLSLVKAQDKLERDKILFTGWVNTIINVFKYSVFLPFGIIVDVLSFIENNSNGLYDKIDVRMIRVKHNNISLLKNRDISNVERNKILEENDEIDKIIKSYDTNKTLIEALAYKLNKRYRFEYDFKKLQQQIENLAYNKLFENAAKLQTNN